MEDMVVPVLLILFLISGGTLSPFLAVCILFWLGAKLLKDKTEAGLKRTWDRW